ncbi:hypothetical protein AA313_de0205165 [Arthrobotrys entomopaga]|nr:hypothetical protein AA313_de0205165 [Arthrobotrys entomopaga]
MSLFVIWDQTSFHYFDTALMIKHMRAGKGEFCSPLLVNAILAISCNYSDRFSNVDRADPFNDNSLGHRFFEEAMRLWHLEVDSDSKEPPLTTIQAGMVLLMTFGGNGMDFLAGPMLSNLVSMSKRIGLDHPMPQNSTQLGNQETESQLENWNELEHARNMTVWGLFHVAT